MGQKLLTITLSIILGCMIVSCKKDKKKIIYPQQDDNNVDVNINGLPPLGQEDGYDFGDDRSRGGASERDNTPVVDPKSSCFKFLKDRTINILASCDVVQNGRLEGKRPYEYEVVESDLCVISKEFPAEGRKMMSVIGKLAVVSAKDKGKRSDNEIPPEVEVSNMDVFEIAIDVDKEVDMDEEIKRIKDEEDRWIDADDSDEDKDRKMSTQIIFDYKNTAIEVKQKIEKRGKDRRLRKAKIQCNLTEV